ncbi:metallophosphoesterase family protein [Methylobacterium sp. E-045]|uniref:metallophosphoesterase family protein n=1 Tax=Methylobacterium sp. E-045 TaxID=2836575 RepID=UPI001FB9759C|nr:metallophosphoesterase family protein [Methylobacterium sp. E-045]MCJ2127490.1 serine/threonine protein phosphatase [Methylobacterium sp. E-045]
MTHLTYAIGDLHGCADALERLLMEIARHGAGRDHRLVFLGDYIDRGPDSAGVLRILQDLDRTEGKRATFLMGNHERMLLDAYEKPFGVAAWLENGGRSTLTSFGIHDPEELPRDALNWMSGLDTVHEDERRYYVHAGFRRGRTGIDPDVEVRLWIRKPFLTEDFDFGKHVVHGHTPQKTGRPDVRPFRTNIDTACVFGCRLTAGVFTGEAGPAIEFLQVGM